MGPNILAKFIGYTFVVISISFICNKKKINTLLNAIENDPGVQFLTGFITLLIGALLIANYNVWHWSLYLTVTIIGWLIFISGIFRLCFTKEWVKLIKKQKNQSMYIINIITLLIGLFFLYLGFFYYGY